MIFEPEMMRLMNGDAVETAEQMTRRRCELLELLRANAYGDYPAPVPVTGAVEKETTRCCSGNARLQQVTLSCRFPAGEFSFPLQLFIPNGDGKKPLLTLINFAKEPYSEYVPVEEIVDHGFVLAYIHYQDVTKDDGDFADGLARFFPRTGSGRDPGKIGLWAWSVSRALDWLLTQSWADPARVGVIGHSRLGKTALWCAANDPRVTAVCSNDSGCMGAAYHRAWRQGSESLADITRVFPFWFCDRLLSFGGDAARLPFDQHFLLACVAPRRVLVNSASLDDWAGPASEQASCMGASPAWEVFGKRGYLGSEKPYGADEGCLLGDVAYHQRYGVHFLGRSDWLRFMQFMA